MQRDQVMLTAKLTELPWLERRATLNVAKSHREAHIFVT